MSFKELLLRAKQGDEDAKVEIMAMYKPMLLRWSMVDGHLDEDLFQEQCITLLRCIELFQK